MLEWIVVDDEKSDGVQYSVVWDDGEIETKLFSVEPMAKQLVKEKSLVWCGEVGPRLMAGLDTDVLAWGTIGEALTMLEWTVVTEPPCPIVPEPEMGR